VCVVDLNALLIGRIVGRINRVDRFGARHARVAPLLVRAVDRVWIAWFAGHVLSFERETTLTATSFRTKKPASCEAGFPFCFAVSDLVLG
jgi:hypothetical protein